MSDGQKWEAVEGHPGWEKVVLWQRCTEWDRTRRSMSVRQLMRTEKGSRQLTLKLPEKFLHLEE